MKYGAIIIENRKLSGLDLIIQEHRKFLPKNWGFKHIDKYEINNMMDYNVLLTSKVFWESIPFDKVLIFQHDSMLLRKGIEEFLEWDYVGAPWKFQKHGGNGGLSLRSKEAMLGIIDYEKYSPIRHGNEDVYFSNLMERAGYNLAPREVCEKFSCEAIFKMGTLGYHAIDKYLSRDQQNLIKYQYK